MYYITYEQIYDIVLQDIQYHASLSKSNAEQYIRDIKGKVKKQWGKSSEGKRAAENKKPRCRTLHDHPAFIRRQCTWKDIR